MTKIAWFSELPLRGKVDRQYVNMRTEFAWFVAQDATHHNIADLPNIPDNAYDIVIIIVPKKVEQFQSIDVVGHLKRVGRKTGFMQEGPSWYFQELPLAQSFWYYNIMINSNFALAHNQRDKRYFEGLLEIPVYINQTLLIEDTIKNLPVENRSGVILGGNFGSWYRGFNSFVVARESGEKVTAPRMGRMERDELNIGELDHLPYLQLTPYIKALNCFKYAVHLNQHTIGGTFSLDCGYLKIPCIGNIDSDTQRILFPDLAIEPDDIGLAKTLMKRLVSNKEFYKSVSERAYLNYMDHFHEDKYKIAWNHTVQQILGGEEKKVD